MYKAKWAKAAKLLKALEKDYLKGAGEFLLSKGYIKENDDLNRLAKKWEHYLKSFDPKNPEAFYPNWVGEQGASNIAANIKNQFTCGHIGYAYCKYMGTDNSFNGAILDFGCGTAAVSMSWREKYAMHASLILADVDNLAKEFTGFMATKYDNRKTRLCGVDLKDVPGGSVDFLACAHVLEHLKNPSEVFEKVSARVKKGGILLLEAPWGGQIQHLPEAPVDWENSGGAERLAREYELQEIMYPGSPLSGVFKKKV